MPMSRNVLHIISGDLWGGSEAQMLMQLRALREAGATTVGVLLFNEGPVAEKFRLLGIPTLLVNESGGIRQFARNVVAAAREFEPNIVQSHGYKEAIAAYLVSRKLGCSLITTYHGYAEVHRGFARVRYWFYLLLQRLIARFAARKIIVVSNSLANQLGFRSSGKLEVNHNTADAASIQSNHSLFPHGEPAIVAVGRLAAVKRLDVAIYAFKTFIEQSPRDPMPHFYIIGTGPEEAALKNLALKSGCDNHIHFMGFRTDALKLITSAEMLLLTSDNEGVPTVILEAVRGHTPIVSADLPGIREVMEALPEYPVRFFPSGSSIAAAASIAELFDASKLSDSMRSKLSEHFEQLYSPPAAARRLDAIYSSILQN